MIVAPGHQPGAPGSSPERDVLLSPAVMELRQLSAFVAVADEGGFSRAAERLGVVQPAVSQAVVRLEEELGIVLFERSSRRVVLTGAGEAFLPDARAVLERLARAEAAARELADGQAGVVRLATTGGAWDVVQVLLAEHGEAHPHVQVDLRSPERGSKLDAILAGELDAAIVHSDPRTPGLAFTALRSEPWHVVVGAAHSLLGNGPVALRALASSPLVLVAGEPTGAARLREGLVGMCRDAGFEPSVPPPLASLEEALIEIGRGDGWIMLRSANLRDLDRFGVVELPLAEELPPATLWLAHRTDPAPAARTLVETAARL
jgi:DNA-binding transcriptional LysR family regulator